MELPDYFLIDLPDKALLKKELIKDACRTLKENRLRHLKDRTTEQMILTLSRLAERWLDPKYPFRIEALQSGPGATGFSTEIIDRGLNDLFGAMTGDHLQHLLAQDLGHWQRFENPVATQNEIQKRRMGMVQGPELIFHIAAGALPNPSVLSLVQGLLCRSAQIIKCASGNSFFTRLFAHSLYDLEPKLGACLEVVDWPGGCEEFEAPVIQEADCISATGNDETLSGIRKRVPWHKRFLAYGHKLSFAYMGRDALTTFNAKDFAASLSEDIAAWNQSGCLSPHLVYVEDKGSVSVDHFADLLAEALEKMEKKMPRGLVSEEEAEAIARRRYFFEIRSAHSNDTRIWASQNSTAWTVVYDDDPRFQVSCLNRFVYVKSIPDLDTALSGAEVVRGKVSTVAVAAAEEKVPQIVQKLSAWGVTRVCRPGEMQKPHAAWRHDGRPSIGDLVRWTDWEL